MDENHDQQEMEMSTRDGKVNPPSKVGVYDRPEGTRLSPALIAGLVILVLLGLFIAYQLLL